MTTSAGASFVWAATLEPGSYRVEVILGGSTNCDRVAQYEVKDAGLTLPGGTTSINQSNVPQDWISLGVFDFSTGQATLTLTRSGDNARTIADAARFVRQ